MTEDLREALDRLEEVASDGDQDEIEDAIAELAGALEDSGSKNTSQATLADILRDRGLTEAAEVASELEEGLETAPSDGEEAEEAEYELRGLAGKLFELLDDKL